jgi:hypothetical protein
VRVLGFVDLGHGACLLLIRAAGHAPHMTPADPVRGGAVGVWRHLTPNAPC